MRLDIGTHVLSNDNQDVGAIKHLILDPDTRQIKTVVIEKGFLLADDIEVPIEDFEVTESSKIRLSRTADQVRAMPRFDENRYTAPPPDVQAPFVTAAGGVLWPVVTPSPRFTNLEPVTYAMPLTGTDRGVDTPEDRRREEEQWRDQSNAVIDQGSDVVTRDGEKLGDVHGVKLNATTGKPESIIVREGVFFTHDVEFPASMIFGIDDGVVTLNINKEEARRKAA